MATTDIESLSIELYLLFMYQITTQQWFNIVTKLLGIRSCSYEEIKNNDYIAASYSLNPDTSVITDFAVISDDNINIENLLNKSRGDYAYTMLDTGAADTDNVAKEIAAIDGVIKAVDLMQKEGYAFVSLEELIEMLDKNEIITASTTIAIMHYLLYKKK